MAKDTYYFSHDYDPIGDPKMQAMISQYGGMGYGVFWRLVEMLHSDSDHRLPLKKFLFVAVAEQMKTTPEFVEKFIIDCTEEFELFLKQTKQNEGGSFFSSNRVFRNFENRSETKQRFVDAGKQGGVKSGESRRKKKELKQIEASLQKNEANEAKERKGKEIYINGEMPKMTENEFIEFSQRMKADRIFTNPLFQQGVKPEHFDKWILRFHVQIVGDDKLNKDYNEYRKHFKNWLNKQDYCNPPPELVGLEKVQQMGSPIRKEKDTDFAKYEIKT